MKLTSHQKVAQVMLSLSPKDAANVLRPLDENELLFVGEAIIMHAKESNKKNAQAKDIISTEKDFDRAATKEGQSFLRIAVDDFSEFDVVKALYKIAFGEKRAIDLVQKLFRRKLVNQLSFLGKYSSRHLFAALHKESTQVISLVLGTLKPRLSAEVIRLFNAEKRKDIIKAIAIQQQPMPAAIKAVENVLREKLNEMVRLDQDKEMLDGEHNLYLILERLSPKNQDEILENIGDAAMRERLEYQLFSWTSLEFVSQKDIEHIFNKFDNKELASLMLVDGVDAEGVLSTMLSESRMRFIEDELSLMKRDLLTQSKEMKNAIEIKRRFFSLVKEFADNTEHV